MERYTTGETGTARGERSERGDRRNNILARVIRHLDHDLPHDPGGHDSVIRFEYIVDYTESTAGLTLFMKRTLASRKRSDGGTKLTVFGYLRSYGQALPSFASAQSSPV